VGIVTRRSLLALGLTATAALFVVTGCGSDDSPGADTTTQVSAPQVGLAPFTAAPAAPLSGAPLDRDGLQRAALTLSELPADFDVVPDPVDDLGLAPDLEHALAALGDREREILALRFGGDMTGPEIAELTDLSLANVQQILSRTLRRMRATMDAPDQASGR